MGAAVVKAPGLALTEEESKQLAAAITRVTDLYDVPLLDEKSRAWLNLGIVGVQIYGTRGAAVIMETKKKRAAKPSVVQMPVQPGVYVPGGGI
jgi:hypothetical protein